MRDVLAPGTLLGYCTNVHAGATWAAARANLERHAVAVKAAVSPDRPLGLGLWLSERAAAELLRSPGPAAAADWLARRGLQAFTLNGFPFDDFHRGSVKHRVYRPDWSRPERREYTVSLAGILVELLGEEVEGSISTLPLGWRAALEGDEAALAGAVGNLLAVVDELARLEDRTGKLIHLDLEPEPGCLLDRGRDVVELFERRLLPGSDPERVRRYLRVCHDVCHAAVMFEDQAELFAGYRAAGIQVGKVQLSSAVRVRFADLDPRRRLLALAQLRGFEEDRYLHQTLVREGRSAPRFFDDLPQATAARGAAAADETAEWRVHFHVPIYLERFGLLETTRDRVIECLGLLADGGDVRHFEAETYAWDVLPAELRCADLAQGIGRELAWLRDMQAAKPAR